MLVSVCGVATRWVVSEATATSFCWLQGCCSRHCRFALALVTAKVPCSSLDVFFCPSSARAPGTEGCSGRSPWRNTPLPERGLVRLSGVARQRWCIAADS